MGVKYVDDFTFDSGFGFTGSKVGRHDPKPHPDRDDAYGDAAKLKQGDPSAIGMAKGGHVKKAQGGQVEATVQRSTVYRPRKTTADPYYLKEYEGKGPVESVTPRAISQDDFDKERKGGRIRKAQGGQLRGVGDDVSKRGMDQIEQNNYDVMRRKRWVDGEALSRDEARGSATNPPDRLKPLTSDNYLPDDDKRRGGPVRMAKGGALKKAQGAASPRKRYADGGAADAPVYPPDALPGQAPVQNRAKVTPAASRERQAFATGMQHGARLGARMATQHLLSKAAQTQQAPRPSPAPPAAPPMQQSTVAPAAPGAQGAIGQMKKGGKFIQGMHLKKGALHRDLGVPEGEKIPAGKLEAATHSSNPTVRRRAVVAETMKGFHPKGKR